ncbi:xylem serine proteinase 1 [Phtheirospermum japonicum]|uniref:Xylem serine proteinase 1 n=1 Tax=Phtheirospermum japonicum TaxID=374723 RepID=A0A830D2I7_9LAMI|nr:xylem serine proteinase 1 [Phtheirospermum japonicum]
MGELPENTVSVSVMDQHHSLLSKTIGDETIARNSKIYSYGRSFNGFAARLLPREAQLLSQKEGVVSVFPNKVLKVVTTRSWDFLGMPNKEKRKHQAESDTILAVFDTGIWVDSPSFNDKGFGPPPKKWKGKCDKGVNFTGCNNKVIGARFFNLGGIVYNDETTPADLNGHGTHTASTAAGVAVEGANVYGIAPGTARGGVPSARIASYKVCLGTGCQDVDLLAAFDAAIADGVDLISVSIGGPQRNFTQDSIAIGSFHAARKGILTVCAAGNDGPSMGSVENVAPWILTVAASTTDRKLVTDVILGNGEKISGIALNTFSPKKRFYPLTNGILGRNTSANDCACDSGTLSVDKIKGKIVYCQGAGGDNHVPFIGGAGTIMSDDDYLSNSSPTLGLATYVSHADGLKINEYINSTSSPLAVIFKTASVNVTDPIVAQFSSRGPQELTPNILKPDIAAPGVDILAAFTKFTTMTGSDSDKRVVKYNVESGTSMATPHVSGAAAYVKTYHPRWSPAAIKSALMTTSTPFKIKTAEAELATGSGQLNPTAALHPGLVYDIDTISYVSLLCRQGYTSEDITLLTGSKKYNCSNIPRAKGADGLNYPSIYFQVKKKESDISEVYYRTVTNVGYGKSVYKVEVNSPHGLSIEVNPKVLTFDRAYEKKSFTVTLKGKYPKITVCLSGSFVWSDSKHSVRSPVLVSYYDSSIY